jgi:uncharacterized glyoxalase superfamily protein PhnB
MADPFDVLRQPVVPVDPRPEFVADLRGRLLRELGVTTTPGGTMTTTTAVRAQSLIPYICVSPADEALAFYAEAFGATETLRVVGPDNRIGHAEITIGDVHIMLSDEYPDIGVLSPTSLGGSGFSLYLEVDDCDAVFERAVAAGATAQREPADQDHGNRTATISDPFGHRWMISAHIEDITLEEYQRRSATGGWETTGAREAFAPRPPSGQLGYYTFAVPDVDRGAAFYGPLFGWSFNPTVVGSDGVHHYGHVNNTTVPMGITDNTEGPTPHLFYRVDDLDAMTARVRELGGEVLEVQEYASGGNAHCRDDQGVDFYLWKPAPEYE